MSKDQVVCQPFLMRQVYNYGLNFAQDVLSATKRIDRDVMRFVALSTSCDPAVVALSVMTGTSRCSFTRPTLDLYRYW
jgi:hypothetical protein